MNNIAQCPECGNVIEYDDSDSFLGPLASFCQVIYIKCPECGTFIPLGAYPI